jgi:hypothetical protein
LEGKNIDESQLHQGFFGDDEELKLNSLSNIRIADELAPFLLNKSWLLNSPPEGHTFIISDNPLARRNAAPPSPLWSNTGLACPGMQVYFPLSPTLTLCFMCQTLIEPFREYKKTNPAESVPLLDAIDSGQPLQLVQESVVYQNSLQVAEATRFLFSCENRFSLADEMLSTNPELANPQFLDVR